MFCKDETIMSQSVCLIIRQQCNSVSGSGSIVILLVLPTLYTPYMTPKSVLMSKPDTLSGYGGQINTSNIAHARINIKAKKSLEHNT